MPSAKRSGCVVLAAAGCPMLRIPVDSADMASAMLLHYCDKHCLGASDLGEHFGDVYDDDGALVAHVSYNGRVWAPDGTLLQEPSTIA